MFSSPGLRMLDGVVQGLLRDAIDGLFRRQRHVWLVADLSVHWELKPGPQGFRGL